MKHKICVIGAGNMGTALAQLIATNGHYVALWNYDPKVLQQIQQTRHSKFLQKVKLSTKILPTEDINEAVTGCQVVILAVASPYIRQVARLIGPALERDAIVVNVAKGIEAKTDLIMCAVIAEEIPFANRRFLTDLSGPSLADEFAKGAPTAVVVACKEVRVFPVLRRYLQSKSFHLVESTDMLGVSFAGVLKNAYAIAIGMCDGYKYSMNCKALLTTVAVDEMARFMKSIGGKAESAYGLAGVGDLIVTGFGKSRNRNFGEIMARCNDCQIAINNAADTVEGVAAAKAISTIANKRKLNLPLLKMITNVLFHKKNTKKELDNFFANVFKK
ncbi:MAG: NAD(P)H-dependent glycerol-3-phosphate dehydrogenase [Candidatus Uhrbacteria bacterium]